ncbi:MAG: amidinotransferase [Acidobacteria bacterium]|nr:amidinotransferase [Acidobacteriota bacterium]
MNQTKIVNKRQTTDSLLMIRPANCGYNPQTAASNSFQKQIEKLSAEGIQAQAAKEFDNLVELLRRRDINVFVFEDTPAPLKPDAVFPNNWVSFHADGMVFLYPMLSEKRNAERRTDIIETLKENFQIKKIIDLSSGENRILEGTGSMVCDHANQIIYACLSPRTDKGLLEKFASLTGYKTVSFVCLDKAGAEIYHTNVVMCVGERVAIVCLDTIKNLEERELVAESLINTNHEIVEISIEQMNRFAGNMLEVRNSQNKSYLLMSATAHKSLNEKQTEQIEKHAEILSSDITTIETVGGGSVRCMLAEIFCERRV